MFLDPGHGAASNQLPQLARSAIMNAVGFARKLARPEQTIDPSEIVANLSLACDRRFDPAPSLPRCYVIHETIRAEIDRVLPKPALQFAAITAKRCSSGCNPKRFVRRRVLR